MEKIYNKITGGKLWLLIGLGWLALGSSSCITTTYYTPSGGTFSGATTYCQGAAAAAHPFNYTECGSPAGGTAFSGVACTVQWYYNTTGGTVIGTSTPLGGPAAFTSSATGSGTINYTPLTTTPGVFYYFANVTWGSGYCTSPFTSGTQMITVNAPPGPITGPSSVCIGSTIPLSAPGSGGTWHSGTTSVATVTTGGIVTGASPGTTVISYMATGCGTAATTTVSVLTPPAAITGPTSVCQGGTITLADATTSGTWSSSATTIASVDPGSGVVSGLSPGTATISFTSASFCSVTAAIVVSGPPGAIAGPSAVCQGSSINLTNPSGAGTWSSSNTSMATVTPASGIVTGASPGTAVISYSNGCGAPATATIAVNALPSAITGATSVCIGATTALSDASLFGTWSSTSTTVATIGSSTGIVSGASAGLTTISYTISDGCAATAAVNVLPAPAPITGPSTVCQGLTATLGAFPPGGTWTSGSTTVATIDASSGAITGVAFGTTIITYMVGIGCSDVRTMTVNPRAAILGRDSVCQGLTTYLTNIVGGGHWTASPFGIVTVDVDSGRVTGLAPGTTTITYSLPTGCQSLVPFRVIAFPANITGTAKGCPGTTGSLADATAGGAWASNDLATATVSAAGIFTGVSADTVTMSYSILPGCAVSTLVTINPLPALITGSNSSDRLVLCPNTTDTLNDASPGGIWSSATPATATVNNTNGVVTALFGGTATIVYTLPTGCSGSIALSVNPVSVPVVNYNNSTMTLSTPDIYVSYQWYDSIAGIIPGATSPSVAALYKDYYYVVVTDTNGCKGISLLYHFNPANVGIKGSGSNIVVHIYPNPANSTLYIEAPERVRAIVSGIDGKKELEQAGAKEIDISRLASGMYFITLYDDDNEAIGIQKFVKE